MNDTDMPTMAPASEADREHDAEVVATPGLPSEPPSPTPAAPPPPPPPAPVPAAPAQPPQRMTREQAIERGLSVVAMNAADMAKDLDRLSRIAAYLIAMKGVATFVPGEVIEGTGGFTINMLPTQGGFHLSVLQRG